MIKITDYSEQKYNRHIRKARLAARGFEGYERAIKISDYFESVGHPHPNYTFNQVRSNNSEGQTEREFASNLMKEMAYLTSLNETQSMNTLEQYNK